MNNLTDREKQAYNFIIQYFKDNGFAPSYQEIADGIYYDAAENLIDSFKNGNRNGCFNATKYYESAKHKVDRKNKKNGWDCDFE